MDGWSWNTRLLLGWPVFRGELLVSGNGYIVTSSQPKGPPFSGPVDLAEVSHPQLGTEPGDGTIPRGG